MIKMIEAEVMGKSHCLFFSNNAMFEINDRYPESKDDLSKVLGCDTPETVESTIDIFMILVEAADAAREYFGYSKQAHIAREDFKFLTPGDLVYMTKAIYTAIATGSDRDVSPLEDTDLYLLEIEREREKKTDITTTG